ncbi:MAG: aldehyde dehydrogenase family protein, partial [Planctomycetota bacterium]
TGGTQTARNMLQQRPGLSLLAETGGKNATIVSSLSDRDLAIKHVLHSAFGHSGQKCSATSLLLLQREIYEDEDFRNALEDAAESMIVGSVWDLRSRVGPMIRKPGGELEQGLKELEPGEKWLVMPKIIENNPQLYRPGIKWNVNPGSFTHRTELFGPVLGVMPYGRLEEAIEIVNATGYGLTSGLESLDQREQELWRENIHAGNLYINRPTTGAIVLRQPFGGIGSSGYGPGAKAGGPHYVVPLLNFENATGRPPTPSTSGDDEIASGTSDDAAAINQAVQDLMQSMQSLGVDADTSAPALREYASDAQHFADSTLNRVHDHVGLIGQDNQRRYIPVRQMRLRIDDTCSLEDLFRSLLAAAAANCPLTVSIPPDVKPLAEILNHLLDHFAMHAAGAWHAEWVQESEEALAEEIAAGRVDRLRVFSDAAELPERIHAVCREHFITILGKPVAPVADVEALRYVNEQSISHDFHRYGNLGRRGDESVPVV